MARYCLLPAALLALAAAVAHAAPPAFDAAQAEQPLRARPDAEVQNLHTLAKNLYTAAKEGILTYQAKQARPAEFAALEAKKIGETHQSIVRLRRTGEWLALWGEAAGADYQRRAGKLEQELLAVIAAYKALPMKDELFVRAKPILAQLVTTNKAKLPAMGRLVQQKKFEEAEAELNEVLDQLEIMLVFYDNRTREDAMIHFVPARDAIFPPAYKLRADRAQAGLRAARSRYAVDLAALPAAVAAAATSLQATGLATVDGQSVSGPVALRKFAAQWQQTMLTVARFRALSWQMGVRERQNPPTDLDSMLEAYRGLAAQMPKALAQLIEADAAHVAPTGARALYLEYLAAAAEVASLAPGKELLTTLDAALARLVARSPQLETEVANYRKLTREVLRWRRLAADSAEKAKTSGYLTLDEKLFAACKPAPPFAGLVDQNAATIGELRLLASVPDALAHAHPLATGVPVSTTELTPIAGGDGARTLATRYRNRTLCTCPWPPEVAAEAARLKADLYVTDEAPAMTLEAAAAIASAERGHLWRAGGVATKLELEPLATYFALLPDAAAPLLGLGPLPDEPPAMIVPEQVLLRVALDPEWLRHEYFFWQPAKK